MFCCDEDNPEIILSCSFEGVNISDLDPHEIFQEGSTWADRKLLYDTIKAYAALTGWKPTLESRTCIKCSFQGLNTRIALHVNIAMVPYQKVANSRSVSNQHKT